MKHDIAKSGEGVDRKGRRFAKAAYFDRPYSASKYVPHIGAKQQAKHAAQMQKNQALV